jgi:hypothetical protein
MMISKTLFCLYRSEMVRPWTGVKVNIAMQIFLKFHYGVPKNVEFYADTPDTKIIKVDSK